MNFLQSIKLDSDSRLAQHFMPHQIQWIQAEKSIHRQHKQAVALAEKSVRIGWTYADAFKNVRKRLWFKGRDYLFATKDYPSALEYVRQCYQFAEIFNLTRAIVSHGEENLSLNRLDDKGRPSAFTQDVKIGVIKFDNGSRIIAFSSNPQAMSVYGGDVGLDEFAKHPNARLLWETAQARVTWNYDLAVWSSHDGEDTLFNEFAHEARAALLPSADASEAAPIATPPDAKPCNPWNIYFRVTLPDAIHAGLVDRINAVRGTKISSAQFLADCRARARQDDIFEQSYMCNPLGAVANHITEWSCIERCRADYSIPRVHLEADAIARQFGEFSTAGARSREAEIEQFLRREFPALLPSSSSKPSGPSLKYRLGFDVAASGQGDLAAIYIDEAKGNELWLRGLFTCRTEDWHFLKTVLFCFLRNLPNLQAAGDESGLGRQICWEAAKQFHNRFHKVNFGAKKHDLGFALMNQLAVAEKRFPYAFQDIASDFFALRKSHNGSKWSFSEGHNQLNPDSHCDIAWAAALSSHAHTQRPTGISYAILYDDYYKDENGFHPYNKPGVTLTREQAMLLSNDPAIWQPLRF